ncbi:MAG: hypothetical protein Q8R08_02395 [bacterium]|nr:hypothetical protein [bacterium]
MKYFHQKIEFQSGISTVEMLIAFLVVILSITAVIGVVFGSQSIGLDTETNQEAQLLAQDRLEDARALSREDFNSVNDTATTTITIEGLNYGHKNLVTDISVCAKQVLSRILWSDETRPQNIKISTTVTSPKEAAASGGDCASAPPEDNWRNPHSNCPDYCADLVPSGNKGSDIDVLEINGAKVAFLSSTTGAPAKPDFWIIDVDDTPPTQPSIISSLETGEGLNALDVAEATDGYYYAYAAHNHTTDQFQIIRIDPSDLTAPTLVKSCALPGVGNSYPQGWSIFYFDQKVYIATRETAGDEFHIYDVSDLSQPCAVMHEGSREINHNVNDIIVRNQMVAGVPKVLAYLASSVTSPAAPELIVLDVTNPGLISQLGSYNLPGTRYATALYLVSNKLYLGQERATGSESDFHILNVSDPVSPTVFGSKQIVLGPNTQIEGIIVSGNLAFIATTHTTAGFQVWSIINPANIINHSTFNYSEKATGIDYLDNRVYVSNESNNALRVIVDNP